MRSPNVSCLGLHRYYIRVEDFDTVSVRPLLRVGVASRPPDAARVATTYY